MVGILPSYEHLGYCDNMVGKLIMNMVGIMNMIIWDMNMNNSSNKIILEQQCINNNIICSSYYNIVH